MEDLVVRKHNHIVQKTINKFSYKQNQLMALLLGKYVNLNDDECLDTSISIDEIRNLLGMSNGSENYIAIRKAIQRFGENGSVGCLEQNKKGEFEYVWRPYFREIRIRENECVFAWNDLMKPYLVELKQNYTQYLANDYLKLRSVHSQNLYEQLKSLENYKNKYNKNPLISVEELRNVFQVKNKKTYNTFKYLNDKLLKKSINEINKVTDLNVKYSTHKQGRTVIAVEFEIKRKNWNYTKKQKENLPDWYDQTEQTEASPELLAEIEALKKDSLGATEEQQTSKRQLVLNYHREHPEATVSEIKEATGVDSKTIRRVLSKK